MRKKIRIIYIAIILIVFYALLGWKLPILWKIECLNLPDGCETIYHTKIQISDVYWPHIKGEKVIKCSLGYEAAKEYIENYNSASRLTNITIEEYAGMSDIAIYNSEYDDEFWEQPDYENYIKIDYMKKLTG